MGAWGIEPAADGSEKLWDGWPSHAATPDDLAEFLQVALLRAEEPGELAVEDCQELVAAAAMVCWLTGMPPDDAPAPLRPLIGLAQSHDFRGLAPLAQRALERVQEPGSSELLALWQGSPDFSSWRSHLGRLQAHAESISRHLALSHGESATVDI